MRNPIRAPVDGKGAPAAPAVKVPQFIPAEGLPALVPHRGKLFLLSRVTAHDVAAGSIRTEYDVTEGCIFYDGELGGVPVWAGFEFMAQSIAALTSIRHISLALPPPPPGVILSVSGFTARQEALPPGCSVQIDVREDYRDDDVSRFSCTMAIKGEDVPLATSTMTVMSIGDMRSFFGRPPEQAGGGASTEAVPSGTSAEAVPSGSASTGTPSTGTAPSGADPAGTPGDRWTGTEKEGTLGDADGRQRPAGNAAKHRSGGRP